MANRTFTANTSCSEHLTKSTDHTPLETSRAGHTIKVFADYAVFDVTAGDFISPDLVLNKNGRRGLSQ